MGDTYESLCRELIEFVHSKHPGEQLYCPIMQRMERLLAHSGQLLGKVTINYDTGEVLWDYSPMDQVQPVTGERGPGEAPTGTPPVAGPVRNDSVDAVNKCL